MIVNAPKESGLPKKPAERLIYFHRLSLDDFRRDEEDQFIRFGLNQSLLEQVAKPRNAAQKRRLRCADGVGGLDDSTDHYRAAIGHQHLRCSLLGRHDVVVIALSGGLRVLDVHGEEDRVVSGDLRSY